MDIVRKGAMEVVFYGFFIVVGKNYFGVCKEIGIEMGM